MHVYPSLYGTHIYFKKEESKEKKGFDDTRIQTPDILCKYCVVCESNVIHFINTIDSAICPVLIMLECRSNIHDGCCQPACMFGHTSVLKVL